MQFFDFFGSNATKNFVQNPAPPLFKMPLICRYRLYPIAVCLSSKEQDTKYVAARHTTRSTPVPTLLLTDWHTDCLFHTPTTHHRRVTGCGRTVNSKLNKHLTQKNTTKTTNKTHRLCYIWVRAIEALEPHFFSAVQNPHWFRVLYKKKGREVLAFILWVILAGE